MSVINPIIVQAGGIDPSDANAAVGDVLATKTFYAGNETKKTGTMVDRGTVNTDITTKSQEVTIASGKHSGSGKVKISATEQAKIIAGNIKKDVSILGVTGTLEGGGGGGGYNYCDVVMNITEHNIDVSEPVEIVAFFMSAEDANGYLDPYQKFPSYKSSVASYIYEQSLYSGDKTLRFDLPSSPYPWHYIAIVAIAEEKFGNTEYTPAVLPFYNYHNEKQTNTMSTVVNSSDFDFYVVRISIDSKSYDLMTYLAVNYDYKIKISEIAKPEIVICFDD